MSERQSYAVSSDSVPPIPEPEPVHLLDDDDPNDPREATELRQDLISQPALHRIESACASGPLWYDPIRKAWGHHVQIAVPHIDCRDHLANERTFLSYLRTSAAISMLGVLVAQLWRLQHTVHPDPVFGFHAVSKSLAAIMQVSALGIAVLGSIRYFRQQYSMARGKVHAGGWEIVTIMGFMALLLLALFSLNVGLDIYKETT